MSHPTTDELRAETPGCPIGTFISNARPWAIVGHAWCKRWACKRCGRRKARILCHRIAAAPVNRFLTLTMRPDPNQSQVQQLDAINSHFRSLVKRLRRKYPKAPIRYVKVVELHKSGAPHLHVALDAPYLAQRYLSRLWEELTGSRIVDIRRVQGANGVAKYLAKYLTKSTENVPGRRRWAASPQFLPPHEYQRRLAAENVPNWSLTRASLEAVHLDLLARSWVQVDAELWLVWHARPPAGYSAAIAAVSLAPQST